jgi:hypothetical protein
MEAEPIHNHNARRPSTHGLPQSGEKKKWRTPTVSVAKFAQAKHAPRVPTDGAADMAGSIPFIP